MNELLNYFYAFLFPHIHRELLTNHHHEIELIIPGG